MSEQNRVNRIEAIKQAHDRVKEAKAHGDAPGKPWVELTRFQKTEAVVALVRELGPTRSAADIAAEGKRRGMDFEPSVAYYARKQCGFSGHGAGAHRAKASAAKPVTGAAAKQAKPVAAVPYAPATLDQVLEGVQLLGLAMSKLGGKANTLKAIETLSTWSEGE